MDSWRKAGSMLASGRILGTEVGSTAPMFLAVLAVHVIAGLAAVIAGAIAALARKGSHRHVWAGRWFYRAIGVVFATAAILTVMRWRQDYHLFIIGAAAFTAATIGYEHRRRRRPGDTGHVAGMGIAYVAMLTGFYVDNGPHLPLVDRLPALMFWLLPSVIGTPIIARAIRHAATARNEARSSRRARCRWHRAGTAEHDEGVLDVTGIRVDVETTVSADPETVWDLLADITLVPQWSPECVYTAWLDEPSGPPRAGSRFIGRNRGPGGADWTVTCEVTGADRPRAFAWLVYAGPDEISSFWRCELGPAPDDGTRVHESFQHGPGGSLLRSLVERNPDRAAAIVANRRAQLREHITVTLAGIKAVAEARA